ncbi:tRNA threonylcarbamoyladenosine dehydratase [bacterium]|nr:tRNA threonylcarbamoyladenosine dehydratase [bacterium]
MSEKFSRTELLFGKEAMEKLASARVAVFGIGGVGGHTAEALVRSGLGAIDIIDNDKVCESNLNRQIYATLSTIDKYKVDAAKERILDINPNITVNTYKTFYMPETSNEFDFRQYDYIVDAIDTVTGKIELIMQANKVGTPIISSMGAGNKMHPEMFEVADIYKTSVCPLARVIRQDLKKRKIPKLKVVYSKEPPIKINTDGMTDSKKRFPGSNAFVPSVAGLIIAGEVIKDLIGYKK